MSPRIPASPKSDAQRKHESRLRERDFQPPPLESTTENSETAIATIDAPEPVRQPTPPKPEPEPRSVSEILRRRSEEAAVLIQAAEEVLTALARGQSLSSDERSLLSSMGLVGERLDGEVRRMTRVLNWQSKSGTKADREKATAASKKASAELVKRGPEIDAEVERLLAEKVNLEATTETTEQVCQRQIEAVKALTNREYLPDHLKSELDDLVRQSRPILARLHTLEGEIGLTARLSELETAHQAVVEHARHLRLECYSEIADRGKITSSVDPVGWRQYIDRRRADDEQRGSEIEAVQAELEPLIAKREALLSHYIPK